MLALREQPGWSNNVLAKRLGVNASVVSQYLNEDGCIYPGDIAKLERSIDDMLANIEEWRDAPLWTPESIAKQTKQWAETLA